MVPRGPYASLFCLSAIEIVRDDNHGKNPPLQWEGYGGQVGSLLKNVFGPGNGIDGAPQSGNALLHHRVGKYARPCGVGYEP